MHPNTPHSIARRRVSLALAPVLFLCLSPGCGDPNLGASVVTYPVKGKVVMADGKPLGEGTVTFVPAKTVAGRQAAAKVESDGTYSLKTGEKDGAAEGEYKIRVESAATTSQPGSKRGLTKPVVPPIFSEEDSSGLTFKVEPKDNTVPDLVLDPSKVKPRGAVAAPTTND